MLRTLRDRLPGYAFKKSAGNKKIEDTAYFTGMITRRGLRKIMSHLLRPPTHAPTHVDSIDKKWQFVYAVYGKYDEDENRQRIVILRNPEEKVGVFVAEQQERTREEAVDVRTASIDPENARIRKLQVMTGLLCVLIVVLIVAMIYEVVLV